MPTDLERLTSLLTCRHPAISIVTCEEADARELLTTFARKSGAYLWEWSLLHGVRSPLTREPPVAETTNPSAGLFWLSQRDVAALYVLYDIAEHLGEAHTLRALRELIGSARRSGSTVVLVDHATKLPPVIAAHTTRFDLSLPTRDDIEAKIRQTLQELNRTKPIEIKLTQSEYDMIVRNLSGLPLRQVQQIIYDVVADDLRFDGEDLNQVLASKRQMMSRDGLLEFVKSPATLDNIGGLTHLKQWLRERERSFGDDAAAFGLLPPRGVLMLGVQGAGKSLCAKAIATAWGRPLLRMDPGVLYDRYVGESEHRLRGALQQAEAVAPVILWIDEIEKAFASAAAQSTDGGLSQRMFGTLLTWMQDHRQPVFLVATANNIDALPPELLRKGRFDEIFFVDLPEKDARKKIFEIHLRLRKRDPAGFDLQTLADASEGYSGAEIEQAVISALHVAFSKKAELTTDRIVEALKNSPPLSVTMAEKVAQLRAWARDRCVSAG